MNRRGFFGWMTAAVGWMVGVKASEPTTITAESLLRCKAHFQNAQAATTARPAWQTRPPTQELIGDCVITQYWTPDECP
jgi:hypothetical protein